MGVVVGEGGDPGEDGRSFEYAFFKFILGIDKINIRYENVFG